MARHNREGTGSDQRGHTYTVGYQPDWLRQVKVTRSLESGRQSTKTLFRNPGEREEKPGRSVRTRLSSSEQGLDIELLVRDPRRVVRRVIVETVLPGRPADDATIVFTIDSDPSA